MKIYNDSSNNKQIAIKDIVYMVTQLDKFIQLYDKCIYETDDEQRRAITKLEDIVHLFKRRDFDYLFEDKIKLIDWDTTSDKFTPDEIKAWREFFKKNPY
jgi:hypothetical protein